MKVMKAKKIKLYPSKKMARKISLAAIVAAQCASMGMSESDTKAAQAAMSDIAQECGEHTARVVLRNPFLDMFLG